MNDLQIKIWDNNPDHGGVKQMFECVTSVYGKLRFILGIGQQKGFNTLIDYKPDKKRFIPLLRTGMPDKNGIILWEGDYVEFMFDENDEFRIEGEIVYEPENACFSVKFTSLGESVLVPLLGLTPTIWSTGKNAYEHSK